MDINHFPGLEQSRRETNNKYSELGNIRRERAEGGALFGDRRSVDGEWAPAAKTPRQIN